MHPFPDPARFPELIDRVDEHRYEGKVDPQHGLIFGDGWGGAKTKKKRAEWPASYESAIIFFDELCFFERFDVTRKVHGAFCKIYEITLI